MSKKRRYWITGGLLGLLLIVGTGHDLAGMEVGRF